PARGLAAQRQLRHVRGGRPDVVPADTDGVLVPAALHLRRVDLRGRQGLTPGSRSLPNRSAVVGGTTHNPGNVCSGRQVPHKATGDVGGRIPGPFPAHFFLPFSSPLVSVDSAVMKAS